jgi:hypothetical protein
MDEADKSYNKCTALKSKVQEQEKEKEIQKKDKEI